MKDVVSYLQQQYTLNVLGDITWAHAVNNRQKLQVALNNPQIMMLEVDVMVSSNGEIILGHPPVTDSDLSFAAFVAAVSESRQGIKLDLKEPETLIPCLNILRESGLRQPVLLNAGILPGNDGAPPKFNAAGFFALCKKLYPQGILSPDWTNNYAPLTEKNIDDMLALCAGIEQITFPVNARLLPFAWKPLSRLIARDGYSLTIWDGKPVDKYLLLWLQENTDPAKVSYDCFDESGKRLRWW